MYPSSPRAIIILLLMLSTVPFSIAQLHPTAGTTTPLTAPASGISFSASLANDRGIALDTSIPILSRSGIDLASDPSVVGASAVAVETHSTSREAARSEVTAPISSPTQVDRLPIQPATAQTPAPTLGANIQLFQNSRVTGIPSVPGTALVDEPSLANNGNTVFYTGNWYAAASTDGGTTWIYKNTRGDMIDQKVRFVDSNHNGLWNAPETVVYDSNNNKSFENGDVVIAGPTPTTGTVLANDPIIRFVDTNPPNYAWRAGDAVVYNSNNNDVYDAAEPVIAGTAPAAGTLLESDFCCDQDVVFDNAHGLFLWNRLGAYGSSLSYLRLGSSTDAQTWTFYNIKPSDLVAAWTNRYFDYPQLSLSNSFLYVSANMYSTTSGHFANSVAFRISLSSLASGQMVLGNNYYESAYSTYGLVSGATSTMYWATHSSNTVLRFYSWADSSATPTEKDITIPAYLATDGVTTFAHCASPDGSDACGRVDDRVLGGWVAGGVVAFTWMVREGGAFQHPYVDIVRVHQANSTYRDNPVLWNQNYAWIYGTGSPNGQGQIGLAAFCTGAASGTCAYPSLSLGISDSLSSTTDPPWEMNLVTQGTNGPVGCDCWGDYLRVRPMITTGITAGYEWIASGFTLQGGTTGTNIQARYFAFGRPPLQVSANPSALTILRGNQKTSTITLQALGTSTAAVSASSSTVAGGQLSLSLSSSSVLLTNGGPSTDVLTISTGAAPAGTYTVTVVGGTGSQVGSTTITVNVASIQSSANPTSLTINQGLLGSSGSSTITLTSQAADGSVSVSTSISGPTPAPTLSLSSNPVSLVAGQGTTILTVTAVAGTALGTYTITIAYPGFIITNTIQVTVIPPQDFSLSLDPAAVPSVPGGTIGSTTLDVTSLNGFSGTVNVQAYVAFSPYRYCAVPPVLTFSPLTVPANGIGSSTVTINATLADPCYYFAYIAAITATSSDGTLTHQLTIPILVTGHDLIVTDVSVNKAVVYRGVSSNPITVSATVQNYGTFDETNVVVNFFANDVQFGSGTLSSVAKNGGSATISIPWSLSSLNSLVCGTYSTSGKSVAVSGEYYIINNHSLTNGTLTVRYPGDVDGDRGTVDVSDLSTVGGAMGSTPGAPNWNPNADLNNDGTIDVTDLTLVSSHFGQSEAC